MIIVARCAQDRRLRWLQPRPSGKIEQLAATHAHDPVVLRIGHEQSPVRADRYCIGVREHGLGAIARNGRDDAVGADPAHTVVVEVGHEERAIQGNGDAKWTNLRCSGLTVVSAVPGCSVAGNGANRATRRNSTNTSVADI